MSTLQEIRAEIECYNRNHGIVAPSKPQQIKKKRSINDDDHRIYSEELDSMGIGGGWID